MPKIEQDKITQRDDKIVSLLSELNSTLDLYYEQGIEKDVVKLDQRN